MCRLIAQYADVWNAWLAFDESSPDVIAAALPFGGIGDDVVLATIEKTTNCSRICMGL